MDMMHDLQIRFARQAASQQHLQDLGDHLDQFTSMSLAIREQSRVKRPKSRRLLSGRPSISLAFAGVRVPRSASLAFLHSFLLLLGMTLVLILSHSCPEISLYLVATTVCSTFVHLHQILSHSYTETLIFAALLLLPLAFASLDFHLPFLQKNGPDCSHPPDGSIRGYGAFVVPVFLAVSPYLTASSLAYCFF